MIPVAHDTADDAFEGRRNGMRWRLKAAGSYIHHIFNPTFPIWTAHPSKFDGMVANFIAVVDPKVAIPGKSALGFNGQPVISLHLGQSPSLSTHFACQMSLW